MHLILAAARNLCHKSHEQPCTAHRAGCPSAQELYARVMYGLKKAAYICRMRVFPSDRFLWLLQVLRQLPGRRRHSSGATLMRVEHVDEVRDVRWHWVWHINRH